MPTYTVQQIADRTGGDLLGPGDLIIHGVDQLRTAGPGQITFVRDDHHARLWPASQATAAVVSADVKPMPQAPDRALIHVPNADLAIATVLEMFAPPPPRPDAGVHPTATVDPSAQLGRGVTIGPGCVIARRVRLGDHCVLHANVTVLDDTSVGTGCVLYPGVVVYDRCELGQNVIIHANAVIGADGFGYRPAADGSGLVKIPQIGYVQIGDDVEIGANTCIDRGKFAATTIGHGTKIDNHCQIAHNCQIGPRCLLASQVGLAGGVTIEDGVVLGGQVGVVEHVTIGAGTQVGAQTGVIGDLPPGGVWFGTPAKPKNEALRESAALRRLPKLIKTVQQLTNRQPSPTPPTR